MCFGLRIIEGEQSLLFTSSLSLVKLSLCASYEKVIPVCCCATFCTRSRLWFVFVLLFCTRSRLWFVLCYLFTRSRLWFVLCYFLYEIQIVVCDLCYFLSEIQIVVCVCVTFCTRFRLWFVFVLLFCTRSRLWFVLCYFLYEIQGLEFPCKAVRCRKYM